MFDDEVDEFGLRGERCGGDISQSDGSSSETDEAVEAESCVGQVTVAVNLVPGVSVDDLLDVVGASTFPSAALVQHGSQFATDDCSSPIRV